MVKKSWLSIVVGLVLFTQILKAQSDLQIFGFAQAQVKNQTGTYEQVLNVFGNKSTLLREKNDFISGSVQQLNIFLRKEITESVTGWVNFEVLNNFSTEKNWGSIQVEEAWVNYQLNDAFSVKGGLLVPRFNHLNEIKNRMPLLPYITRPLIFEPTLKNSVHPEIFLPERAFLQVTGTLPTENVLFDYAVFVGNSELKYQNADPTKIAETGSDTVTFKMVGGRVGAKYKGFYLGVSTTFDNANYQATLKENVKRNRLGFDFGGSLYNFFAEGEYINVTLDAKNTTKDLDKSFYYATLGYNITDEWHVYGSISKLKDADNAAFKGEGLSGNIFGVGYKPSPALVLKAEFSSYKANNTFDVIVPIPNVGNVPAPLTVDVDFSAIQFAVSFLF